MFRGDTWFWRRSLCLLWVVGFRSITSARPEAAQAAASLLEFVFFLFSKMSFSSECSLTPSRYQLQTDPVFFFLGGGSVAAFTAAQSRTGYCVLYGFVCFHLSICSSKQWFSTSERSPTNAIMTLLPPPKAPPKMTGWVGGGMLF